MISSFNIQSNATFLSTDNVANKRCAKRVKNHVKTIEKIGDAKLFCKICFVQNTNNIKFHDNLCPPCYMSRERQWDCASKAPKKAKIATPLRTEEIPALPELPDNLPLFDINFQLDSPDWDLDSNSIGDLFKEMPPKPNLPQAAPPSAKKSNKFLNSTQRLTKFKIYGNQGVKTSQTYAELSIKKMHELGLKCLNEYCNQTPTSFVFKSNLCGRCYHFLRKHGIHYQPSKKSFCM